MANFAMNVTILAAKLLAFPQNVIFLSEHGYLFHKWYSFSLSKMVNMVTCIYFLCPKWLTATNVNILFAPLR